MLPDQGDAAAAVVAARLAAAAELNRVLRLVKHATDDVAQLPPCPEVVACLGRLRRLYQDVKGGAA